MKLFNIFFFKQKTAYEMRISDWSSDVCSSDLDPSNDDPAKDQSGPAKKRKKSAAEPGGAGESEPDDAEQKDTSGPANETSEQIDDEELGVDDEKSSGDEGQAKSSANDTQSRSEEHPSELQSLMRNSYAVFCLTKKRKY